eukprot:13168_1
MAEQKYDIRIQDDSEIYLLIQGCTATKGNHNIAKKKGDDYKSDKWGDGKYLGGMPVDIFNMDRYIKKWNGLMYWHNTLVDREGLTRQRVLNSIDSLCKFAKRNKGKANRVFVYYTGHGVTNKGDWCFSDGVVKLKQIIDIFKGYKNNIQYFNILCDCCYSGNWALELEKYKDECDMYLEAATWPGFVAYDNEKNGGYWTQLYTDQTKKIDVKRCSNSSMSKGIAYYIRNKRIWR